MPSQILSSLLYIVVRQGRFRLIIPISNVAAVLRWYLPLEWADVALSLSLIYRRRLAPFRP